MKRAIIEETWLIFLVAVGVERHRPALLITKIAETAEVHRGISQPLEIFLTRFAEHGWIETGRHGRLGVRIDVAQLAAEVHIQARVLALIVLAGMRDKRSSDPAIDKSLAPMVALATFFRFGVCSCISISR